MRNLLVALLYLCVAIARADELPQAVSLALKSAGIPVAATAVWVREVDAAAPRLSVNARAALNPASTMKLVTTFAALDLLGPAYVWKTEAFATGMLNEGVLTGDLHLRGGGDPKLTYDQFARDTGRGIVALGMGGNDTLNGAVDIESRRWRNGERDLRATNDSAWRRVA